MVSRAEQQNRERIQLARKRLLSVLGTYTVACMRTLEQKIADAGPYGQRIDPHVLTIARKQLQQEGVLNGRIEGGAWWYYRADTDPKLLDARLAALLPIHHAMTKQSFGTRAGDALEIAIYRSLELCNDFVTLGSFRDLNAHDDSNRYSKEEPPSSLGTCSMPPGDPRKLDFVTVQRSTGLVAGIEAKNIREWIYPHRDEVTELIDKCLHLDAVPVLIARRIHFATFRVFGPCGLLIHQTYNQRFPEADQGLADQARRKDLLGYHDIHLGNTPDDRLNHFLHDNLPVLLPDAKSRFDEFSDLLEAYCWDEMPYEEFAARVRRRLEGTNEDHDWEEDPEPDVDPYY